MSGVVGRTIHRTFGAVPVADALSCAKKHTGRKYGYTALATYVHTW